MRKGVWSWTGTKECRRPKAGDLPQLELLIELTPTTISAVNDLLANETGRPSSDVTVSLVREGPGEHTLQKVGGSGNAAAESCHGSGFQPPNDGLSRLRELDLGLQLVDPDKGSGALSPV